ncbi:MAG: PAS domain S-box protein [Calditrichaeota bacterium]|nr:MAG: PAS domain S-box protein [Calditrichota bacterium]
MTNSDKHNHTDSMEKFQQMVEFSNDAIFLIDPDNAAIIYANLKAEKYCQLDREKLYGLKVWELHPEDEKDKVQNVFETVKKESFGYHNELNLLRPDKSTLVVDVSSTMITCNGIQVIQRICHDITNRKKLMEDKQQILDTFRLVLDMMPVGFGIRSDLNGTPKIIFENIQLKKMFHTDDQDHNHDHWDIVGKSDVICENVVIDENGTYVEEHKLPDGRIMQFTISYIRDLYNEWRELQIVRDVTKRRELEQELISAKENLEEKVKERTLELQEKQTQLIQAEKMAALGNLVAGVAHEINTPMGALKSNNDLFKRYMLKIKNIIESSENSKQLMGSLAKFFENIDKLNDINETAAERIIKIVQSLKNFARLDQSEKDTVDIHEGIESTLTLIHHEIKNKIIIEKDYKLTSMINCYPNQLNQVFMNILVNAAQAIEKEGTIKIKTYQQYSSAYIEISDTGKGIPESEQNRIFDPGFTTKGVGIGTGLGLSIVHQIIQHHNGDISLLSEENKGTTFTICLPIK